MVILSAFSRRTKVKYTACGSPEYVESFVRFSPDGNMFLETGAVKNRQAEINSYKAACDINLMIRRYENGDQTALLRDNTGAYVDLSNMPKHIHEAEVLKKRIHSIYDSMGADIKSKYSSLEDFLCAFSTESDFKEFCGFAHEVVKKRAEPYIKKANKEDKTNA